MKSSLIYITKFLGIFCLLYFGTQAVIGMSAPGGRFSNEFITKYFDYVSWIKISLIRVPKFIFSLFGIASYEAPGFQLRFPSGRGVIVAYSCVGYGVYSFWTAFVAANKGTFLKKAKWIVLGVFALWFINMIRIMLFALAVEKGWPMPLGIDHHTWFNIFAYILIFVMIILYDRSFEKRSVPEVTKNPKQENI